MALRDDAAYNRRLESIEQRLGKLERFGNVISSTQTVNVFDDNGKPIVTMGKLASGIYGVSVKDDAGSEIVRLGEFSDGRHGLQVFNASGTERLRVGEQSDGAYDFSAFDASGTRLVRVDTDGLKVLNASGTERLRAGKQSTGRYSLVAFDGSANRIIEVGEIPSSRFGLEANNTSGAVQVRVGQLAAGGYGLEAVDGSGNVVPLSRLAFDQAAAVVSTGESTTSTSYTDLATSGPSVSVTIGNTGRAIVFVTCTTEANDTETAAMSFSGAGVSADDSRAVIINNQSGGVVSLAASAAFLVTGLSTGSQTFTAKYRSFSGGSVYFVNRHILVFPF